MFAQSGGEVNRLFDRRAYLDGFLQDYSGANILALAAYNAGPHRVRRWIKDFGGPRDPDVDPVD